MTPYYLILVLLIVCSIPDPRKMKGEYKFALTVALTLLLVFFAAFRGYDPDWSNYADIYREAAEGSLGGSADVGFNILLFGLNQISREPVFMFFVVALLSVSINIRSFYRYTPYIFLSILLYFVHNYALKEMIQIRAGLSSALCLYSLRYLPQKDYGKAIAIWIVALTVHLSALIFCLTYIAHRLQLSRRTLILFTLASLAIGTVYPLGQIIKSMANLGDYSDRAAEYVLYGDSGYAAQLGIWTNVNTVKCLLISGFLFIYHDRIAAAFPYFRPLFYAYVIGLCWLICFNDFAIVGARMSNILLAGECVLLTYPYVLLTPRSRWIYTLIVIGLALVIFHFNIGPEKITPYLFYFNMPLT